MSEYTVQQAKEVIKDSVRVYLQKDKEGEYVIPVVNRIPFYLEGAPGVGKTQMTEQIAKELGIGFVSLSITHYSRSSVLGLPVIQDLEDSGKYTEYTRSEILAMVDKEVRAGYEEGILLIDEFSCMAESLVAPMLAFLQTRNIGNHRLPEGWIMVLCSNPPKYNKSARVFDMAVMDRVRLMQITFDAKEFIAYGKEQGFHDGVLEYLKLNPEDAHVCSLGKDGERLIVTTRGWENLSWTLEGYEEAGFPVTKELVQQFIKSDLIAHRFLQFYQSRTEGLDTKVITDILEGNDIPKQIGKMKRKPYTLRYQVVELLGRYLTDECESFTCDNVLLWKLERCLQEMPVSFESRNPRQVIEERLSGTDVFCYAKFEGEVSPRERTLWRAIGETYDAISEQADSSIEAFKDAIHEVIRKTRQEMLPKQQESSDHISHCIEFVVGIQGEENLIEILIHMLGESNGVLDTLAVCENPMYLKYSRQALGTDLYEKLSNNKLCG